MVNRRTNRLPEDLWQALRGLGSVTLKPDGKPLFCYGEPSRGIYLVDEGEVRLILSSGSKPGQTFELAGPGTVLGLSETLTGGDYKLTAEVSEGTRIFHIERGALLEFLRNDHQLCLRIVRLLSEDLHSLYYRFRCLAPGETRTAKNPPAVN